MKSLNPQPLRRTEESHLSDELPLSEESLTAAAYANRLGPQATKRSSPQGGTSRASIPAAFRKVLTS